MNSYLEFQKAVRDLQEILRQTRHQHPRQKTKHKRVLESAKDNRTTVYKVR
jgi:hypothetical protein